MKNNNKKIPIIRRYAPLIVIGGILLLLSVAFLVVSKFILSDRSDDVSRTLAERRGAKESGEIMFRNDANLTFSDAAGRPITSISVEIADTEEARTQGLMGRTRMGEKQGMLFIFPNDEYRSFWMANTPLPLDIIYVDSERNIVTVRRNTVPFSEESIPSTAPARYVVEVNAGFCNRHGILEGASVSWARNGN